MAYATTGDDGSTLSPQERLAEAVKLLHQLEHSEWKTRASDSA